MLVYLAVVQATAVDTVVLSKWLASFVGSHYFWLRCLPQGVHYLVVPNSLLVSG